ncbi:antitoxin VbhA family protein [Rhodococcus erythropolis]|nr:antitoxin VbhA family protein [Rhodococcus erythropolis]
MSTVRDEDRRRRAVRQAYGSLRLEGQIPTQFEIELAELFVVGEIDLRQLHDRLVALTDDLIQRES